MCEKCDKKDRVIERLKEKNERLEKVILDARGKILFMGLKESHPLFEQVDEVYHILAQEG